MAASTRFRSHSSSPAASCSARLPVGSAMRSTVGGLPAVAIPGGSWLADRRAAAQLVNDAEPGHVLEPALEGTTRRIVNKVRQLFGHGEDGFLHDVLGFLIREAGFDGDAVDEFPVSLEEYPPTGLVLPIAQPVEQAATGGQQFLPVGPKVQMRRHNDKES